MQMQRGHGGICFPKSASLSPLRLRLPCAKIDVGPLVVPVRRATSDRSLNLNLIPFTSSALDRLKQEQDEEEQDESKELAAAAALTRNSDSKSKSRSNSMALALMFASWNLFNIYFNIFNKQVG